MATKLHDTCLEKSQDDEPIFVLVARDEIAPEIVEAWIDLARRVGVPEDKLADAQGIVQRMIDWQNEHGCKKPD